MIGEAGVEIYTHSLHDALPIYRRRADRNRADVAERIDLEGEDPAIAIECDASLVPLIAAHVRGEEILAARSEEHTSELQSRRDLVCRLLLEKINNVQLDTENTV